MLQASQFDVIDLGADVSPEAFVESIKKEKADVVGMSALLTVTMQEMKTVVDQLRDAGLRSRVKIMIGGAAVTEEFAKEIGADAYGATAVNAVGLCKGWVA
jgi:methanogenic corrinoid protein MtbC1